MLISYENEITFAIDITRMNIENYLSDMYMIFFCLFIDRCIITN